MCVTVDMWQAEKGQCWERSLLWPNTLWQLGHRSGTRAMLLFHLTIFKQNSSPSMDSIVHRGLCGPRVKAHRGTKKKKKKHVSGHIDSAGCKLEESHCQSVGQKVRWKCKRYDGGNAASMQHCALLAEGDTTLSYSAAAAAVRQS